MVGSRRPGGSLTLYHERSILRSRPGGQGGGVLSDSQEAAADQEVEDILAGRQERLLNTALH